MEAKDRTILPMEKLRASSISHNILNKTTMFIMYTNRSH